MLATGGRPLVKRPVRPVRVVMVGVLAEDQPQVPFAGDQHPVQALAAGAAHPAFRDRVGSGRPHRLASAVGRLPSPRLDVNGQFGMLGGAVAVQDS
jgi:hypothetical protein